MIEKVDENSVSHFNNIPKILIVIHKAACPAQYFERKFTGMVK